MAPKGRLKKGYVQVYTGNGKGKTTAALGLSLRAVGNGLKVYIIQFMKGSIAYGELETARRLAPDLTIVQMGRASFVDRKNPSPKDIEMARQALDHAGEVIRAGEHDIVILDELNCAVDFGLVTVEDALSIIDLKPERMELVLTGRNAHEAIVKRADLVSEIKEVKHYYHQGVDARVGVER